MKGDIRDVIAKEAIAIAREMIRKRFERQMALAEKVMEQNREALKALYRAR